MSDLNDLQIDSDAAERAARACRTFASEVDNVLKTVAGHDYHGGFGSLPSGRALEKKYSDLAIGDHDSLKTMLEAHYAIGNRLADTFTEIGRKYDETDDAIAESLRPR